MIEAPKRGRSDMYTTRKRRKPNQNSRQVDWKTKLEIANDVIDNKLRQCEIARKYNISKDQARNFHNNAVEIKKYVELCGGAPKSKIVARHRPPVLQLAEEKCYFWLCEQNCKGFPTNKRLITAKVKWLLNRFQEQLGTPEFRFTGSNGWWQGFLARFNLKKYKMSGEKLGADAPAVAPFIEELQTTIREGGYHPSQIYNIDETAMFWKMQYESTFAPKTMSRIISAIKKLKNRVTLLLGSNATGDHKLKPLMIHSAANPNGFPKKAAEKQSFLDNLPVHWRVQKKGWMELEIFEQWFIEIFVPEVYEFHQKNYPELDFKILLILDNAPVHKSNIDEVTDGAIKLVFLPPNTTCLIQPQDQAINRSFKANYINNLMKHIMDKEEDENISIHDFFKSFGIAKAIPLIGQAWEQVTQQTLKNAWNKLLFWMIGFESQSRDNLLAMQKQLEELASKSKLPLVKEFLNDIEDDIVDIGTLSTKEISNLNKGPIETNLEVDHQEETANSNREEVNLDAQSMFHSPGQSLIPHLSTHTSGILCERQQPIQTSMTLTNQPNSVGQSQTFTRQLEDIISLYNNSSDSDKYKLSKILSNATDQFVTK